MPTVAAFEERLERLDPGARDELVRVADGVLAHRFDLLGSGPTDLGPEIDWHSDFKAGRRWPLDHISKVVISYPDGSDIKVPWELSRFQHLPVLAGAQLATGDDRYLEEIGSQLDSWIAANPVEFGPNWACTMDVAIRAANWTAALVMCTESAGGRAWFDRAVASLLLHGRFIRRHLEYADRRGNHYLADVVGLMPVAALFSGGREGRAWARWATGELRKELLHQVRADGCDHEASIPYHRLVCELFICGTQAAEALCPGELGPDHHARLAKMLDFVADYTRPDGLAPQIGDADDGRFLPLDDYGNLDPRDHRHLFQQARREHEPASTHAAYPEGGYWTMRAGDLYAIVRCGDVGVGGIGPHAHSDQLSFELSAGADPLVVDPGSYVYTSDPEARRLFRSTRFHSTLAVDETDQNPVSADTLFEMEDVTRSEVLAWEPGEDRALFRALHHGYERLHAPAVHERTLELDGVALRVTDVVRSEGCHDLEWTFPLPPGAPEIVDGAIVALFGDHVLRIESDTLELTLEPGWLSPSYGVRVATSFARARKRSAPGEDRTSLLLAVKRA